MTRYKLTIEYDGGAYMGWQRQPHGPTIQSAIEDVIFTMTAERVTLHAAGRTDAGVHARAMVAHVDIARPTTPFKLSEGINALLRPQPVTILACAVVPADWHARFSCTGRRYLYRIINRRPPLTLDAGKVWRVRLPLDHARMQAAANLLIGTHDFTTFRSVHCQSASPVKSLDCLSVTRAGDEVQIEAAARSFLHHQVRSMVGCLVLVGHGKWGLRDMQAALDAKDRTALGFNAPPDGLYFMGARYTDD